MPLTKRQHEDHIRDKVVEKKSQTSHRVGVFKFDIRVSL